MKLALSILGQDISKINWKDVNALCDRVHIDLADGEFVSSYANYPPSFLNQLPIKIPIDIHFMTKNPSRRFAHYAKLRMVRIVNFHIEIGNTLSIIEAAKKHKLKVGIAINPTTPIEKVFPFLEHVDEVLIMSVHPGESGQKFIKETSKKIEKLRRENKNVFIKVDGGIDLKSLPLTKGADMVVSASYVFNSPSPKDAMLALKQQK